MQGLRTEGAEVAVTDATVEGGAARDELLVRVRVGVRVRVRVGVRVRVRLRVRVRVRSARWAPWSLLGSAGRSRWSPRPARP